MNLNAITHFTGTFAEMVRTAEVDLYVFATNSKTTEGDVGYRLFLDLDSDQQDTIGAFIAILFNAKNCYIYSKDSKDRILSQLQAEGAVISYNGLLIKAPLR